ncbi:MAG: response regulator [Deltaproteobacteria bacterium]|nr:response regulator [Deltaproteobacteria bacterium]
MSRLTRSVGVALAERRAALTAPLNAARSLAACLAISLAASPGHALSPTRPLASATVQHWSSAEGLPQDSVKAILQTRDGYLWIGTEEGLARFDGVRFHVFSRASKPALPHDFIRSLFEDAQGSLWIGTDGGGLLRYAGGAFTTLTTKDGLTSDSVWDVTEDHDGVLWIATLGGGLNRYADGVFSRIGVDDGLASAAVVALTVAKDGSVWATTKGAGLARIEAGKVTTITTRDGLCADDLWAVREDQDGGIWVSTEGKGVCRYKDGAFSQFTTADGLAADSVWSIYADRQGALWFGSEGGGVSRYADGRFETLSTRDGLANDIVVSIGEDHEGSLWLGTYGGGLDQLRERKVSALTRRQGLGGDTVWAVRAAADAALWVGLDIGGAVRFGAGEAPQRFGPATIPGFPATPIRAIAFCLGGRTYLGSEAGLVELSGKRSRTLTVKDGLPDVEIRALLCDAADTLWVGTKAGGLAHYERGRFTVLGAADGLSSPYVRSILDAKDGSLFVATPEALHRFADGRLTRIPLPPPSAPMELGPLYQDPQGALWIGTFGAGLWRYQDGAVKTVGSSQGLFDDTVFSIVDDGLGFFWFSSNKGLFRVLKADLEAALADPGRHFDSTPFTQADGMPSSECAGGGNPPAWRADNGRLHFPTVRGVAIVDPGRIPFNHEPPLVHLERVLANGVEIPFADAGRAAVIPAGTERLQIDFTALSFAAPSKVRVRSILKGFDAGPRESYEQRSAGYTNLPPGDYTFEVAATNDDGVWSPRPATLSLHLEPHLYQTRGFLLLTGVALTALIYGLYVLRTRHLRARRRQLCALVEERRRLLASEKRRADEARAVVEEQARELAAAAAEKSLFFANVSHEFRTPLTLIIGPLERILADRLDAAEKREQLEMMRGNADRLSRLIDELLAFCEPDRSKLILSCKHLDLGRFLTASVDSFRPQAKAKGVALELNGCASGPTTVWADEDKLDQIVVNLVGNALKFTPAGGRVTVSLKGLAHGATITVADTGPGMSAETRARLFSPWQGGDGGAAHVGTGLGLALVKELVDLHAGQISIDSEPGHGTRACVELPAVVADAETPVAALGTGHVGSPKTALQLRDGRADAEEKDLVRPNSPRILIVEDNRDMRLFVSAVLKEEYSVHRAADGEEGWQRAQELGPDLIVSDVTMPWLDGYGLCERLRAHPPLAEVPVLLLTGVATAQLRAAGLAAGATDYLVKPFDPRELSARVKNLLAARQRTKDLRLLYQALHTAAGTQWRTLIQHERIGRYVSKKLRRRILSEDSATESLASTRKVVTVFFSHLDGFDRLVGTIRADVVQDTLNQYLSRMVELIDQYGGTLDKFMGDGVMVLFGAPDELEPKDQAQRALHMAVHMSRALEELCRGWGHSTPAWAQIRARMGVNQDYVTVGSFGSSTYATYSALGGGVNLASRLASACSPGRIMVSYRVYSQTRADFAFAPLFERGFKGFARPLRVAELDPQRPPASAADGRR